MQRTEPMKTGGRKQKRIKQELNLKTCAFQIRTYKEKSPFNLGISDLVPRIPTSFSYTEIKTMPKPLTIIRGSLHKWAKASCNKSLGSPSKCKSNVRGKGRKKKKDHLFLQRLNIVPAQKGITSSLPLKEWASIKPALPHVEFQEQFKLIPWLLYKILNPISFGPHLLKKSKRWPI